MSLLTQDECIQLRDQIFAKTFPMDKYKAEAFRYVAVLPGGPGESEATIHWAYSPPVWERAGISQSPENLLKEIIQQSSFKDRTILNEYHEHLRFGWPIAWDITQKRDSDNFPTLVLFENHDGSVTGALMRDPHNANSKVNFTAQFVEPIEAKQGVEMLREAAIHDNCYGWYKDTNIDALSLQDAITQTPETHAGQKTVVLYRNNEWLSGIWNNPEKGYPEFEMSSVADFYGTPVSKAKKESRSDITNVRDIKTIDGDYSVLMSASELALRDFDTPTYYDDHPAVKMFCDWWNMNAPESLRSAGAFRLYTWNPQDRVFNPGDPEEPAMQVEHLDSSTPFALFESPGQPSIVAIFYRARSSYTESNLGTQTYHVNGDPAWEVGQDIKDADEAYYGYVGLKRVRPSYKNRLHV